MKRISFSELEGFEWDEANIYKNELKHSVHWTEIEEVFFNEPVIVNYDHKHSIDEDRWYVLGRTDSDRLLFVVFTIRGKKIRVISARDMSRKERKIYLAYLS